MIKESPKYSDEMVDISTIIIDENVQRPLNMQRVNAFVAKFNPAALGILTLSRRNPVTLAVIDGQHRLEAFRRVHSNQGEIACRVFEGLSLENEAQMFIDLNTTAKPRLLDAYSVRVVAKDPVALDINRIIRPFGWDISNNQANGYIQAISAVERLYRLSKELEMEPNLLDVVIRVITHAWGLDRDGVAAPILTGIGNLVAEHGAKLELDRLESVLRAWKQGPANLFSNARAHASASNMRVANAVSDLLTIQYNKGRTTRALPSWRKRS